MKIVQALEDTNILLKGVTKTIKNETKKQKGEFLSMLLGTLGTSSLGNFNFEGVIWHVFLKYIFSGINFGMLF